MICKPKNEATLPHLFQEKIDYDGLHKKMRHFPLLAFHLSMP